jgi:conserved oligomeric Golgi complex subunit 3
VIGSCADTVCRPLRAWLERVAQHNTLTQKQALAAQGWASEPAVSALVSGFREACLRDLRAAVARLKLYLEEERTVAVLVKHMQERIVDEYAEFRRVVWSEYSGTVRSELNNEETLRMLLQEACGADAESATEAGTSATT